MIVLNDTLGVYGGSQTLLLRMCQWLNLQNIKSVVLCRKNDNMEIVQKIQAYGTQVICLDIRDVTATERVFRTLQTEEKLLVISFIWNYYLDLERLKRVSGLQFSNIIYAIHPATFQKGSGFRSALLRSYAIHSYGKILARMNVNHALYSMDEDVLDATRNYMHVTLAPPPPLLPLPMFCEEKDNAEEIIRHGFKSRTIMTATRAEYPYKGYLLGLIDDFKTLKGRYPDLKLEIVTGGVEEDVARLRLKLGKLPSEYQRDVVFHNWMDYDALKRKMEDCTVFIGMGTSVLDAALAYKPAIPVKYNTYENLSDTFLSVHPEWIAADPDCQTSAIFLLERTLQMSPEEYREACLESFWKVKEYYDIDKTMRRVLEIKTPDTGCIMTRMETIRHHLNNQFNRIFRRETDRFAIQSIRRE